MPMGKLIIITPGKVEKNQTNTRRLESIVVAEGSMAKTSRKFSGGSFHDSSELSSHLISGEAEMLSIVFWLWPMF